MVRFNDDHIPLALGPFTSDAECLEARRLIGRPLSVLLDLSVPRVCHVATRGGLRVPRNHYKAFQSTPRSRQQSGCLHLTRITGMMHRFPQRAAVI